jgi:AcrR family transcriptional regulator
MDLFAANGYDQTTVDEVACAAGISLRSFFRYFASKGDLMSYGLVLSGQQLTAAIDACPSDASPREMMRESITRVASLGLSREIRTRKHLDILARNQAAAAAEMSRLSEVRDAVAMSFERRLPVCAERAFTASTLALVSLHLTGVAVRSCLEHDKKVNLTETVERLLANMEAVLCSGTRSVSTGEGSLG